MNNVSYKYKSNSYANFWWIGLWLIVALTNTHIGPDDYLTKISALDTSIYLDIAKAAPGFPADGSDLVFHGAQRLLYPYVIGLTAGLLHVDIWTLFQGVVIAATFFTTWIFWNCALKGTSGRFDAAFLLTSVFICHPFLFRLHMTFSGFVNDAIFNMALCLFIYGLQFQRTWLRVLALAIMIPAKQTVFLIVPAVFLAEWLFDKEQRRTTIYFWLAVIASIIVYYAAIKILISPFSTHDTTRAMAFGFLIWISHIQGFDAVSQLARFTGRGVLGLLPCVALSLALYKAGKKPDLRGKNKIIFALFLGVIAQPIISGPATTDASIQRLLSLGFAPFLVFLAPSLRGFQPNSKKELPLIAFICFLASIHHLFSILGPDLSLRYVFLAFNVVSAIGLFYISRRGLLGKSTTQRHLGES